MYRALVPGAIGVKVPFTEAVRLAKAYRFEGIGVSMAEVNEFGLDGLRKLLQQNGLVAAQTGMPVNFRKDDATFEEGMRELPAFCQAMAALGCTRVATWLSPWHETLSYKDNFEQLRVRTTRICQVLARYGLRYGLEFVGPQTMRAGKPNPFIHDLDGLMELLRAVGTDNVGILLDAFHWYVSGGTAADLNKLDDRLVVVVHVNDAAAGVAREAQIDNVRAMPGETGVVDIATFMQGLARVNYGGPVVVEPFSAWLRSLPPERAVAETAISLDKIWRIAGLS